MTLGRTARTLAGGLDSEPVTVTIDVSAVADTPPAGPTPSAGAASPPAPAAPAEPAIAQLRLASRCVRRSRAGRVRIRMTLRMARPAPLQIRIERAVGSGASDSCPSPSRGRRFTGRFREIATIRQPSTAATAAAVARRITLKPRLAPGLYRITVRAELDGDRLSRPLRRYLRVLG